MHCHGQSCILNFYPRVSMQLDLQAHAIEYAGVHHPDKIAELQSDLQTLNASALAVCALDEIAWLLNIRGADIQCNPVSIAYAVVARDKVYFFVNGEKLSDEVRRHLGDKVEILPYEEITNFLTQFTSDSTNATSPVIADYNNLNWAVYQAIKSPVTDTPSLIERKKAIKHDKEIEVRTFVVRWQTSQVLFRFFYSFNYYHQPIGHPTSTYPRWRSTHSISGLVGAYVACRTRRQRRRLGLAAE